MTEEELGHREIIIVRRGGGDHDDHHGGVWKIAFADFMTAMMAFFLVMWLINASNEQTKKSVASYFNPVKLMDTTTNPRGVKTPKYGDIQENLEEVEEETTNITSERSPAIPTEATPREKYQENAIFVDPMALISEIAGGIGEDKTKNDAVDEGSNANSAAKGLTEGELFQDPFDPNAWSMKYGKNSEETAEINIQPFPDDKRDTQPRELAQTETDVGKENAQSAQAETKPTEAKQPDTNQADTNQSGDMKPAEALPEERNIEIAQKLEQDLAQAFAQSGVTFEHEVVVDANGAIRLTLMEGSQALMFEIGSARPSREVVLALRKVAARIVESEKNVTVQGHTDGRPFRSKDYDNWRLSSARAQMAMYILQSGGVPETQFSRVEGHAERNLKFPDDPLAPGNRRIEIILSDGMPNG